MGNSVGSLFIDIQARMASLQSDIGKVKAMLGGIAQDAKSTSESAAKAGDSMASAFARVNVSMMVIRPLFRAMIGDIDDVVKNIEKIPGVPGATVASIQTLRTNLEQAKTNAQQMAASVIGFIADVGTAAGATMGQYGLSLFTQGRMPNDVDVSALADHRSNEQIASEDPNYDKEKAAALKVLGEERRKLAEVTQTLAEKIQVLREQEQSEEAYRNSSHRTGLEDIQSTTREIALQIKEKTDMFELTNKLAAAEKKVSENATKGQTATMSHYDRLNALKQQVSKGQYDVSQLNLEDPKNQDPTWIQKKTDANNKLAASEAQLNAALRQQKQLYDELGDAFSRDLVEGTLHGEGLHAILQKLTSDIVELIAKEEIEKPLASMFSAGIASGAGALAGIFGLATGGPYVANQPFVAGENGPELIVPGTSGSVSNASDTAKMGGGGGGDTNVEVHNHFAAGVTQQQLSSMVPMIVQQSKAAVFDAVRRGGAARQIFMNGQ